LQPLSHSPSNNDGVEIVPVTLQHGKTHRDMQRKQVRLTHVRCVVVIAQNPCRGKLTCSTSEKASSVSHGIPRRVYISDTHSRVLMAHPTPHGHHCSTFRNALSLNVSVLLTASPRVPLQKVLVTQRVSFFAGRANAPGSPLDIGRHWPAAPAGHGSECALSMSCRHAGKAATSSAALAVPSMKSRNTVSWLVVLTCKCGCIHRCA
jgi:hypothetical protein